MTAQTNVTAIAPRPEAAIEVPAVFNPQNFWPKSWDEGLRYATLLARAPSMLPKHIRESKDPVAETFATIMFGFEVGLAPLQSLRAIYIVHGRAGMYAADQIAIIQNHRDCEKLEVAKDSKGNPLSGPTSCTWVTKRRGRDEQRLTFTIAEAEQEGLVAGNAKYKTSPALMLRWRCATRLLAFTWGDVLRGLEDREHVEVEERDAGWAQRVTPPPPPSRSAPSVAAKEEELPPHDPNTGEVIEAKPVDPNAPPEELTVEFLLKQMNAAATKLDLQACVELVTKAKAAGALTAENEKDLTDAYKNKKASFNGGK